MEVGLKNKTRGGDGGRVKQIKRDDHESFSDQDVLKTGNWFR